MPSMNAVARATVEGGLNTRRCITTRMNSVTQKTGRAHRSAPSARATSREDAVPCMHRAAYLKSHVEPPSTVWASPAAWREIEILGSVRLPRSPLLAG